MTKFIVMDVDGTLTDGKIYIGADGELFKAFNVKDGYAIKEMIPKYGRIPIIITARDSEILRNRCNELNIKYVYQGVRDKLRKLTDILLEQGKKDHVDYSYEDCAYIGDDILDLQCMEPIKTAGGLTGCPADAVKDVRKIADYVCSKNSGDGAVREFVEWVISFEKTNEPFTKQSLVEDNTKL